MFDQTKPKTTVSTLALATILGLTAAFAQGSEQPSKSNTNAAVSESVQDEAAAKVDEKRKALLSDATSALDKTKEALEALDDAASEAALEALAVATGKLQSVVVRDPDLALAPVDVQLVQRDLLGDVDTIRDVREEIEDLVKDGKLQQARPLMRDFASEIVVETTHLPLATYPDAILRATAEIDRGETEKARQTLATALSTVVVTEDAIALPVLRAQLLIDAAEEALGEGDGGAAETKAADTASADAGKSQDMAAAEPLSPRQYVEGAREQLKIAEALGYGEKGDFKELYENLDDLDEKIEAGADTGGIFDRIGDSFIRLKQRIFD